MSQNPLTPLRTVVLVSGSGSTLQNLIDLQERGELPIEIVYVISSRQDAYGITRALNHNIPTATVCRKDFSSWKEFNTAVSKTVDQINPDLILLAGYMSKIELDDKYRGKVMNVHPALLPAFGGKGMYGHHVHEAVIASGTKITGATVHFVAGEYDTGPIILQKEVEVLADDTPETLAERVQAAEREIYSEAIRMYAAGLALFNPPYPPY